MQAAGKFTLHKGFPDPEFFGPAWASEPLTNVLKGTDVCAALPMPDDKCSVVAKDNQGQSVGQCSANAVTKYWNHIKQLDLAKLNMPTQIFVRIHLLAVKVEQDYLLRSEITEEQALHNAGIAVLPQCRGKRLGILMEAQQIQLCRQQKATLLFCETTNKYSAQIMQEHKFTKLAEFSYAQLAVDLNCPDLGSLKDSFTVWCLKV